MNLSFLPEPPKGWAWSVHWKLPDKVTLTLAGPETFVPTFWSNLTGGKGRSIGRGAVDSLEFTAEPGIDPVKLKISLTVMAHRILKNVGHMSVEAEKHRARQQTTAEMQSELTRMIGPPQPDVSNWEPAEELR